MNERPFKVLGIQQIAISGVSIDSLLDVERHASPVDQAGRHDEILVETRRRMKLHVDFRDDENAALRVL